MSPSASGSGTFSAKPKVVAGADEVREAVTTPTEGEALRRFLENIERRLGDVEKAKVNLAEFKASIAEFNFQALTILLGVLTLAVAVPFAFLYGGKVTGGTLGVVIAGFLATDTILALAWMLLWRRLHFPRKPSEADQKDANRGRD
jgi:hypothetical protein